MRERTRRVLLLVLILGGWGSSARAGGNIFITGHDMLLHSGQNGYDIVVLDYLRQNSGKARGSYNIGVIGSSAGAWAFSSGTTTPSGGYPAATFYDTALLNGSPALQAAAVSNDVLIILSHTSCGGCDLTTFGSAVINSQMAGQIASAVNAGMDLWVNAGARLPTYYDFLPPSFVVAAAPITGTVFCPTTAGAAIGITTAHTQGFQTHSRFPSFQSPLTPLEADCPMANVISLGAINVTLPCCDADVTGDGLVTVADFNAFTACFGACPPNPACEAADANCDGCVDAQDSAILTCQLAAGFPDPDCCSGCIETLDFEDLLSSGTEITVTSPYTDGNYEVSGSPLQTYGTGSSFWGTSTAVHGDRLAITRNDATDFRACTLELTELNSTSPDSQSFVLFHASGPPTWEGFALDGLRYFPEPFTISSSGVSVWAAGNRSQIDNVCICEESGIGQGDVLQPCVDPPSGLVAWWTGDAGGNANSYIGPHHGAFSGTLTPVAAPLWVGPGVMNFDIFTTGVVVVPASSALVPGSGDLTLALWVHLDDLSGTATPMYVSGAYALQVISGLPSMTLEVASQGSVVLSGATALSSQSYHFLAAIVDRGANVAELYVDGVLEDSAVLTGGAITAASNLLLGTGTDGQLDEVQIWKRALDPAELEIIRLASFTGECKSPIILNPNWNSGTPGPSGLADFGLWGGLMVSVPFPAGATEAEIADLIADGINADATAAANGVSAISIDGLVYVTPAAIVSASASIPELSIELLESGVVAGLVAPKVPMLPAAWVLAPALALSGMALLLRRRRGGS